MFTNLSDNITNVFGKLKGKGLLTEDDVNLAMREVRIALLEADVALPVVKEFINSVKAKAVGEEVIKSVSPAQMVIKLVQDAMTEMLGDEAAGLNLRTTPPAVVMMVGLQGSGKTTSTAKLALHLRKEKKRALLASLDVYRPAAQEQLATLGKQVQIDTLAIKAEEKPEAITKRALKEAKAGNYDVLFLDTAGRLQIDAEMMEELQQVKKLANPIETMLVADSLTGQDAVNIASSFNEQVGITGIMLTRIDGDGRGGAALSMKAVTGCPIKFLGTGETLSELEIFHPERIASRILGMGDVVSLVEKAAASITEEDAKRMEKKLRKGNFDLDDLSDQLSKMQKLGGMGGIMSMLPGMGKMKQKIEESGGMDDAVFTRQKVMISSMTKKERQNPDILNASRKRRIVAGSGTNIQELNKLLKTFKQMQGMMKKVGKMNKKDLMRNMGGLLGQ